MALGERFRGSGARGIAQFLAEHQHCDAGFDVRRDEAPGSGKLTITCQGCGQTVSYNAAEVGEIGAFDLPEDSLTRTADREPVERAPAEAAPNGSGPPARSESGSLITTGPGPRPAGGNSAAGGLPPWLAPAAIGLVIAAGVAMIAIGLIRSGGDGETSDEPSPTQAERPVTTGPAETTPAEPELEPEATAPTGDIALQSRSFGAFACGVPAGWTASRESDGASLVAPGSTAALTILAGRSDLSPIEFARQSEAFLAGRRPGAQVGDPEPLTFLGRPGARTIVSYSGAEEQVTFVSARGFVFALIKRVEGGASAQVEAEAEAALTSFEPG